MDSEIPDYIDIMLKQAQVDTYGIVIEQFPQVAVRYNFADFIDGASVCERVIYQQYTVLALCFFDKLHCLVGGCTERLCYQHMLAGFQCTSYQIEVRGDRCGNRNRVNSRVLQHFPV